jgi:hypothetical protein
MKKTKIIKIIQIITPQECKAMIFIPLTPLSINSRSTKPLIKLFNDLIGTPIKILKKKEIEILNNFNVTLNNVKIKRIFNILVNDVSIQIVKMHDIENNEEQNINNYLKEIMNQSSILKYSTTDAFIFEYNIQFKI